MVFFRTSLAWPVGLWITLRWVLRAGDWWIAIGFSTLAVFHLGVLLFL